MFNDLTARAGIWIGSARSRCQPLGSCMSHWHSTLHTTTTEGDAPLVLVFTTPPSSSSSSPRPLICPAPSRDTSFTMLIRVLSRGLFFRRGSQVDFTGGPLGDRQINVEDIKVIHPPPDNVGETATLEDKPHEVRVVCLRGNDVADLRRDLRSC